jgi:hypothetical protein
MLQTHLSPMHALKKLPKITMPRRYFRRFYGQLYIGKKTPIFISAVGEMQRLDEPC